MEHGNLVANYNGQWSPGDADKSSTWWEFQAVRLVLDTFQKKLMNEWIRWFSDNQNVVTIVQYERRQAALQSESLSIFVTCLRNNRIEPEWIPRRENELVDYYSCIIDYDDYMLHPLWSPHGG